MTRTRIGLALAGVTTLGLTTVAAPATAAAPDTACMRAGIAALKSEGLFAAVAKGGLPISAAVSKGVTVREGADISGVPNPIPFSLLLAVHRAGDGSAFVYPWC